MRVESPQVVDAMPNGGRPARVVQWVALIVGIGVLLAVVSPPVDEVVDRSFSAHMLQHMVLTNLVAVLFALSWPLVLGKWPASRFVVGLNKLANPAPALLLLISTAVLWFWHVPAIYDAALDHRLTHRLEHVLFLGAFVLYWRPLMSDSMSAGRLRSNEVRVLYLTIGMLAMGALAAYIMFADHLIYPHYANSSFSGRTPLQDQELGGAIMLIIGAVSTIVVGILTLREEP